MSCYCWKVLQISIFVVLLANLFRWNLPGQYYTSYVDCLSPKGGGLGVKLGAAASSTTSTTSSSTNQAEGEGEREHNNTLLKHYLQPVSNRVPAAGIETILVTSTTKPPFHFFAHATQNDFVTASLVQTGVYEKDSTTALLDAIVCSFPRKQQDNNNVIVRTVDLGANIGFHSLHMASCGAHVVSFEASPDTAWLLRSSALLNGFLNQHHNDNHNHHMYADDKGSITIIPKGVSNTTSVGRLSRHHKSPGMTSFVTNPTSFSLEQGATGSALDVDIPLVRAASVLDVIVPPPTTNTIPQQVITWRLLKVDVEGFEYQALQGIDLQRYPFDYITLEFFPALLRASGTDPATLLTFLWMQGYRFLQWDATKPVEEYTLISMRSSSDNNNNDDGRRNDKDTQQDVYQWAQRLVDQGRAAQGENYHVNLLAKHYSV